MKTPIFQGALNLGDDQWERIEHRLPGKTFAFSVNVNKS